MTQTRMEVRGHPTDDELAALVVVLTATSAGSPADKSDEAPVSAWGSHERRVGRGPHPGPGGWRASALPG